MKQKCIIVDLEGTLSDHSHRVHLWNQIKYDEYNALFLDDPVNLGMVDIISSNVVKGIKVVICTAKEKKYRNDVLRWLGLKGVFVFSDAIYMRETGDKRPSVEVKKDLIRQIIDDGYQPIKIYDDRDEILQMAWMEYGIPSNRINIQAEGGKSISAILTGAAELFREKSEIYGYAYKRHGNIMSGFFPEGITLKTPDDFHKFHLFELDVIKSNRIATAFVNGKNHKDSWEDKIVYSAMGEESCDE